MGKVAKSISKSISKGFKGATKIAKNVMSSPVKAVSSLAKGDFLGAATNLANVATMGTVDATGGKKGIVNVNTPGYVAKLMGVKPLSSSHTSTSGSGLFISTKGLVRQTLRQAKGGIGGGSYTETVKNPLGGSSSKTGK